ncbi:phospholipase D family protein [Ramlibacter sp. H39-3-26]|uniref:phospholipase D family protein n=1 Tax=Curvibacter soli TaxID=3031331 RepID=UPI0023DB9165|nr:phospholipase D family protein [Ramlibacter sp. H39-3-26]MDF1485751.1 phospholipase D family protein [Ramlibacter sp. H39-3-26]
MGATLSFPHRRICIVAWGLAVLACLAAGCASLPDNVGRTPSYAPAPAATADTRLGRLAQALRPAQQAGFSGFHALDDSESAYGTRLALIEATHATLDLQYYSIHYDGSTRALLQAIRRAGLRGVRVRILLDDFNASGANARVLLLNQVPNVEVRMFNPLPGPRRTQFGRVLNALFDFQHAQQRMHNKVLVADNAFAITGGRNLGDAYFGQGQRSNFLDLDLLTMGPVIDDISHSFDAYWNHALAYPVETLLTPGEMRQLRAEAQRPEEAVRTAPQQPGAADDAGPGVPAAAQAPVEARVVPDSQSAADQLLAGQLPFVWAPALLLADKPGKIAPEDPEAEEDTMVDGLQRLMQQARHEVLIVSAYFVPGDDMMEMFARLAQRGVRVRVLTNSLASNDAPLAHVGYARYRQRLLALGVELYELRSEGNTHRRLLGSSPASHASLHTKLVVIDGRLLVVGSMNLDLRSKLQNTEVALVVRSTALAGAVTRDIAAALDAESFRLELVDEHIRWTVPARGTQPAQQWDSEPDAGLGLRLLLLLAAPFAPDEML